MHQGPTLCSLSLGTSVCHCAVHHRTLVFSLGSWVGYLSCTPSIGGDVTSPSPLGTSLLETRDYTASILGSAVTAFQVWVRFPMPQGEWRGLRNPWTPSLESFMEVGGGYCLVSSSLHHKSAWPHLLTQWFCIMESEEHTNGR